MVDAAVAAGADQISGPSLTHSNPAELYRQALRALEQDDEAEPFLGQVDLADVATATRTRLGVLGAAAD